MGATLDYGEIDPGESQFIFINPNDPTHSAAQSNKEEQNQKKN